MVKKMSVPLFLLFLLSILAFTSIGKVNFSGEWKLDKEQSNLSDSPLYLSKIVINQQEKSVLTTRTNMNQYGEQYPFDEEITLDGEESEIVIYEMTRRTRARWSDDGKTLLIKSKTKYWGNSGEQEFTVDETWGLDKKGEILSIDFDVKTVDGTNTGTYLYKKAEE